MKNEKLARAISDIDDELIEEAHGDMLRRRMPLAGKLAAIAACFIAVLFTAVVWHRITAVGVSVYGLDVAKRGAVMLSGDMPDNQARIVNHEIETYSSELEIPLTVSTVGNCHIEVSDGTVIYSDPVTGEKLEGRTADISCDTDMIWSIALSHDEPSGRFLMKITKHGNERIFSLSYDSEKLDWVLTVEK